MRKLRIALIAYCLFDLLIGGVNGGFLPLTQIAAAQNAPGMSLSVISQPSANAQATASVGAADNIRHVADGVCIAAGAISAPTATTLAVNLRDGATGAGTILATWVVAIPATAANHVNPTCMMGLSLAGTAGTAMTAEWSAGLTAESESVTLIYHNTAK